MDDRQPEVPDITSIMLRRELVADGWTDKAIARAVRDGVLVRVRYGAYVWAHLVDGLTTEDLARVRSRAVLRTAHPTSVLCSVSALAELGVPLWGVDLSETHLVRTDGRAGRREAGVAHHSPRLDEGDCHVPRDVPVVRAARAAVETVVGQSAEVGLVIACLLVSLGHVTLADLHREAARTAHWPHALGLRMVLAKVCDGLTTVGEARAWHFFHAHRIPRPERQVRVHDEWGRLVGIVDFLWRSHGVFLEFDGRIKYEQHRRDGETLEAYLRREKLREERICQLTGWVCIRITWADLERPAVLARRLQAVLASRPAPAA